MNVSYLSQESATQLDAALMGEEGAYTSEQLMELAGLCVAQCIFDAYPPSHFKNSKPIVLVCCGSGNNGGDGMIAARHLNHFGYRVSVCYPVESKNPHISTLIEQLRAHNIPIIRQPLEYYDDFNLIVDAILGFGFKGPLRGTMKFWISQLAKTKHPRIISIDVPSGWKIDSESVDEDDSKLLPSCLISLTLPKLCARAFQGIHYIGGRFVPEDFCEKYGIHLPIYPKSQQFIRIS